jgi:hypothetical protein
MKQGASLSRRAVLKTAVAAVGATLFAPLVSRGRYQLFAWSPREYSARCIDLVRGSLVIDMLGLTSLNSETEARWGPGMDGMTDEDVAHFRNSGIDVFHIASGVGGRTQQEAYQNVLAFVGHYDSMFSCASIQQRILHRCTGRVAAAS